MEACLPIGIVCKGDSGRFLSVEMVRKMDFVYCLILEIARTVASEDGLLIEMVKTRPDQ